MAFRHLPPQLPHVITVVIKARTTELLCNTSQFQEFTSSYPQYSLRALLEKKIIRMMYTGAADDETLCLPIERTKDPVCETGHFISTIDGKLSQLKSSI